MLLILLNVLHQLPGITYLLRNPLQFFIIINSLDHDKCCQFHALVQIDQKRIQLSLIRYITGLIQIQPLSNLQEQNQYLESVHDVLDLF